MERKKKECVGFNGKPHEDYIYKNIDGKKYCKSCTFKLQPPKSLKKMSEKFKFKLSLRQDLSQEDNVFYLKVWHERFFTDTLSDGMHYLVHSPKCENCTRKLIINEEQEEFPLKTWFHHLLPKYKFPKFRHEEWNIAILCENCHSQVELDINKTPKIKELRDKLLDKIKN